MYTQAKGCDLCIHVGTVAFFFGDGSKPVGRLEVLTPFHLFRWSPFNYNNY